MALGTASPVLEYAPATGVSAADGDVLRACTQCGTCAAVCPLGVYMDHSPRQLIALLRAGRDGEALRSRALWVCTSCYACTVECPEHVPVTDAIYALKRASMRTGVYPRRFPTPVMARQLVSLVDRWGRSTESWVSIAFYARTGPAQLVRHAPLALQLLRRGRLSFRRESVRNPAEIRRLLRALEAAR